MASIFISYRQSDSKGWVDFLRNELAEVFESSQLFLDRDTLAAGSWREQINGAVVHANVTLLVIGPKWLDDTNRARLMDPSDVHRNEISAALRHQGSHVIPVLVDDAQMPCADQLPEDLLPLLERQARRFSSTAAHREADMKALVADLMRIGGLQLRNMPIAEQSFCIPFKLDEAQARAAMTAWFADRSLAPDDFATAARITQVAPAWAPFWTGSADASGTWKGSKGVPRTEEVKGTDANGQPTTKSVTHIDQKEVAGTINRRVGPFVVDAGATLSQGRTLPEPGADAQRAKRVAQWPDETVRVVPATVSLAQAEARLTARMTEAVRSEVMRQIGGEKSSITDLQPRFEHIELRLVHQPVFEGTYSYAGKDRPFCIDADSGAIESDSPVSAARVGWLAGKVLLGLTVVAGIVALVMHWR